VATGNCRQFQVDRPAGHSAANRIGLLRCILEGRNNPQMDFGQEIAKKVGKLPPDMQEKVLRFVTSLSVSALTGENGAALRRFSSSLDSVSARQMIQAINEECERVDAKDW